MRSRPSGSGRGALIVDLANHAVAGAACGVNDVSVLALQLVRYAHGGCSSREL